MSNDGENTQTEVTGIKVEPTRPQGKHKQPPKEPEQRRDPEGKADTNTLTIVDF